MANVAKIIWELKDAGEAEILMAYLGDENFYAFEEEDKTLISYIKEMDVNLDNLQKTSNNFGCKYKLEIIEDMNWNEQWESDFQKVIVNNFACVRANFHTAEPDVKFDLLITPKMSFGTGHHATTFLMIEQMESIDFTDKSVFDYGTGTGVLAILAEKMGASVTGIDIDDWSITNTLENVEANQSVNLTVYKSDDPPINCKFDVVLANINTHVLVEKSEKIKMILNKEGLLLVSGFLSRDIATIKATFQKSGFMEISIATKDDWNCILFKNNLK